MDSQKLKERLQHGEKANPFWICGPCVIENRDTLGRIAEKIKAIADKHNIPIVFKASFDKANRTSHQSYRGIGFENGLEELLWVGKQFELPILTDVHETSQIGAAAQVADILQIPAFLCRQTDLLAEVSRSGRLVNVKKGQFVSPANVVQIIDKLRQFGASGYWITERGVSFGYQRLVVDFAAFPEMERAGAEIILDITHAVQLPGASQGVTGGIREAIPYLARAGAAVGVSGFFAETHPNPPKALSDASNAWPLDQLETLILSTTRIAEHTHGL